MPSDRSALERQIESVELRPFTLDGFHRRRERKQRNRRIGAAAVALAIAAAGIGGMASAFRSGPEPTPADEPSNRFLGSWNSTELNLDATSQTMTIRAAEDGGLIVALHDDSSSLCSTRQARTDHVATPSTMTGTGRLEDATTLVVPSPVLACADGREPNLSWGYPEEGATSYTLVLDLATGRLFDNLGVAWHRGATPENGDTATEGSERTGPGTYAMLGGEITFRAAEPWIDHIEAYLDPRLFFLIGRDDGEAVPEQGLSRSERYWQRFPHSIEILANPVPPPASCVPDAPPRVPASADEVVRAIRSNPELEATVPVAEEVGGIDALRLDVAPVPGACSGSDVSVVSVANSGWGSIGPAEQGRLYILDLPGGSARALVIMITGSEAVFERTIEAAAPVVESFEFHTK